MRTWYNYLLFGTRNRECKFLTVVTYFLSLCTCVCMCDHTFFSFFLNARMWGFNFYCVQLTVSAHGARSQLIVLTSYQLESTLCFVSGLRCQIYNSKVFTDGKQCVTRPFSPYRIRNCLYYIHVVCIVNELTPSPHHTCIFMILTFFVCFVFETQPPGSKELTLCWLHPHMSLLRNARLQQV